MQLKKRVVATFPIFLLLCLLAGCGSGGTEKVKSNSAVGTVSSFKSKDTTPISSWSKQTINLPADNLWHGYMISYGKQYRYKISGEVVVQDGFGAVHKFHGDETLIFFGSQSMLQEMERQHPDAVNLTMNDNRLHANKAGNSGSGVAAKSGMVWFLIETRAPLNGGLTVILESKK